MFSDKSIHRPDDNPSQTVQFRITITETFWYGKNDEL